MELIWFQESDCLKTRMRSMISMSHDMRIQRGTGKGHIEIKWNIVPTRAHHLLAAIMAISKGRCNVLPAASAATLIPYWASLSDLIEICVRALDKQLGCLHDIKLFMIIFFYLCLILHAHNRYF